MRCKACDCMLKDTNAIWREVKVEGSLIRMMEDLCPTCRSDVAYDDDDDSDIPTDIRAIFNRDWETYE